MSNVARHHAPVWLPKANFIIKAALDFEDGAERFEQFWAHKHSDHGFEICCIPFFTYGIALGDTVEASEADGYLIDRVLARSGRKTLRLAIAEDRPEHDIHSLLHDWVEKSGLLYEFFKPGYLAIDLPPGYDDIPLGIDELIESEDVHWEIVGGDEDERR